MKRECRCHGPSASCVTETCWQSLPAFREIGGKTLNKLDYSQRVRGRKVPSRSGFRVVDLLLDGSGSNDDKPKDLSMVYISKSPTYCEPDYKLQIMGTSGRICNRTTTDDDNCGLLCCGRGYDTHEMTKRWLCNCRFEWCCRVICKKCKKNVEVTRCK